MITYTSLYIRAWGDFMSSHFMVSSGNMKHPLIGTLICEMHTSLLYPTSPTPKFVLVPVTEPPFPR